MVLRSLTPRASKETFQDVPCPAFAAFLETQKDVPAPYAIVFQSEHARLSGDLAHALSPDVFGVLPPEVIAATGSHDAGWDESDAEQMEHAYERNPRPFPSLLTAETLPSWQRSIRRAQQLGDLQGVLVSRHFGFVGSSEPDRQDFLQAEESRRGSIEASLGISRQDLDRWTAAMGFCDVLSLYLCSGCRKTVYLPFAHPASPSAEQSETVTLHWHGDSPLFSKPLIESGTLFNAACQTDNMKLSWRWG